MDLLSFYYVVLEALTRCSGDEPPRILIYSHLSDSRDGEGMLRSLIGALRVPLQHVVLTTYDLRGLGTSTRCTSGAHGTDQTQRRNGQRTC
jgi:hypothetical protein